MDSVRLDKWLWAARFYKSRSIAKHAIEGGKVHYEGARVKVSKEVSIGATLRIRQGWGETTVEVLQLSDQRRGASEAQALYRETEASIEQRELLVAQRKAAGPMPPNPLGKPDKRSRRLIHQFKEGLE